MGKLIVGNTYETLVPTSFSYTIYDDEKYNLTLWQNKVTLANPKQWFFNVKLKPGIKFKVIKVLEHQGIDSGKSLKVKIKLDNIPLSMIDGYVEADVPEYDDDKSEHQYPIYIHRDMMTSKNPELSDVFSHNNKLKTKNLILGLYAFQFFDYDLYNTNNKYLIKEKNDVIKKIT